MRHVPLSLFALLIIASVMMAEERWMPIGVKATDPVTARGGVVAVASLGGISAAVRADGTVTFWGQGAWQMPTVPPHVVAIAAYFTDYAVLTASGEVVSLHGKASNPSISSATAIALGYQHGLALLEDGTVTSWRYSDGFAGRIPGVDRVVSIASAGSEDYAVRDDGTVLNWNQSFNIHQMAYLSNVSRILAGGRMALHNDGTTTPLVYGMPSGLTDVKDVIANEGTGTAFVLKNSGEVAVYGAGTASDCWLPADLGLVDQIAGNISMVALRKDGSIVGWNNYAGGGTAPTGVLEAAALVSGYGAHAGIIDADGRLHLWGPETAGEASVPVDLGPVLAARTGSGCTIALRTDGSVRAWGDNRLGQTSVPVIHDAVTAIAVGREHALARTSNGAVVGWGSGLASIVPSGLTGISAIAAGSEHSVALRSDGTVVGWGGRDGYIPAGLQRVGAIAAGDVFTTIIYGGGGYQCYGVGNFVNVTNTPYNLLTIAMDAHRLGGISLKDDGHISFSWNTWQDPNPPTLPTGLGMASAVAAQSTGVGSGTFYVRAAPIPCPISLQDATVVYDGKPHCLQATPSIPGVFCSWSYDGQPDFPINVGSYAGVATVDAWAYQGSAAATLRIVYVRAPAVTAPSITNDVTPTWTWTGCGGGVGEFRYALDDAAMLSPDVTTDQAFTPPNLVAGNHTLYVQERDAASHWSDVGSATVTVDTTPPTVTLLAPVTSMPQGANFTVRFVFSEPVAGFGSGMIPRTGATIRFVYADPDQRSFLAVLVAGPPGEMRFSLGSGVITDLAGNPNQASTELVLTSTASAATQPSEGLPGEASAGGCGVGVVAGVLVLSGLLMRRRRN